MSEPVHIEEWSSWMRRKDEATQISDVIQEGCRGRGRW